MQEGVMSTPCRMAICRGVSLFFCLGLPGPLRGPGKRIYATRLLFSTAAP